jgi:hypothetical protein
LTNGPNLFARLHKWATRQDENFVTESLAITLEQLLILAPEVGTRLIRQLTGGLIDLPPADASAIGVQTQVDVASGRPDLEVSVPHKLVWVEVKVESDLRVGQLEGYRVLLAESGATLTRLVLLSRYPVKFAPSDERPDLEIRWYQVAEWVENELIALEVSGPVAVFLGQQFLEFLRARKMTLTQVGKFMPEGLRAWGSLLNMLFEAAKACNVPTGRVSASRDSISLSLDGGKYWIGIEYANPEVLWFGTWCRIDSELAARLDTGELGEDARVPGRHQWWRSVELESEEVHFFLRSKVGQMEWLEKFIRDCIDKARSIETPDQPPIPDDSGED